jgi:HD-GYP domain-containing protein (c-di-GMP phosphodiesterase class II)
MSILVRKKKLPPHEAKEIVEETLKTGIIDPVIVELFKES